MTPINQPLAVALAERAFKASPNGALEAARVLMAAGAVLLAEAVGDDTARAQVDKLMGELFGGASIQ